MTSQLHRLMIEGKVYRPIEGRDLLLQQGYSPQKETELSHREQVQGYDGTKVWVGAPFPCMKSHRKSVKVV